MITLLMVIQLTTINHGDNQLINHIVYALSLKMQRHDMHNQNPTLLLSC